MSNCVCMRGFVCVHNYACVGMCACVFKYVCVYMCVCVCVCVCVSMSVKYREVIILTVNTHTCVPRARRHTHNYILTPLYVYNYV